MTDVEVAEGVQLFVQDLGADRAGTAPLVLLPGFGMTHEVWDRQVRVAAATRRVLAIDQRGHGRSDAPLHGYDLDTLVGDLVTVLDACDVPTADVVGWSFGGQVAFRAAATHPDRVSRLVLVGSNGVRASRSETFPFGRDPEKAERVMVDAEHTDRVAARRTSIAAAFAREPRPDVVDHLAALSLRMPSWAAVACARTMFRSDLTADLPAVTAPVLQVMGTADPVHRIEGARWLQQRLADSRLVELPDCGHYPMFEAADAFDEALSGFVRDPLPSR